jgi:GMP synthase-like glutamine amidotransferase
VPWLARELALVRRAAALEVPTFGICFGGQLLARALGGSVQPASEVEIGWRDVRTWDNSLIAPGPWFQWHFDSFTPPPGASVIADSTAGPQAFRRGRTIGLQFHPEVTAEIVRAWAAASPEELRAHGVDPAALVRETAAGGPQSRAAAWRLFDGLFSTLTADGNDRR